MAMKRISDGRIFVIGLLALAAWLYVVLPLYYLSWLSMATTPTEAVSITPVVVQECFRRLLGLCFVIPPEGKGGIFGFAEFVQAFALLVLIFTVTGVRYQFRVATAPIRLWLLTYWGAGSIGALALLSDLWFAQRYPLPLFLSSQAYWQFALGLLFLSLAMTWLWYAYVRPPKFGRANAFRFTHAVYRYVMQGNESDLPVVADELERSADSIIKFASAAFEPQLATARAKNSKPRRAENYACDLLLIIGNRRFCRYVAGSAPNAAIALFRAVAETKQYNVPMSQFSSALSTEAILNKDSLLYHEDAGYFSGYFGYTRPFTNTIFGDYEFVEALATNGNSPLDVDLDVRWKFDGQQLEAYTRAALTTFKAALAAGAFRRNSYALNRAFGVIENACSDLYKLSDPLSPQEKADIHDRLRAVVGFINDAIDAMEKAGVQKTRLRRHDETYEWHDDYYDRIAELIFEVIGHAVALKTKEFEGWTVQYSSIWSRLSNFDQSKTRKIVLFKVRRLLYEQIKGVETHPNFLNVAYLGYCLNVLGLKEGRKRDFRHDEYPLRKAIISFARKNYLALVQQQPKAAAAVLVGTISFDKDKKQLVKTYSEGLNPVAPTDTLDLI
jgi:hypothetical protein